MKRSSRLLFTNSALSLVRTRHSCPAIAPCHFDESPQFHGVAQHVDGRVSRVLSDRFHQKGTALAVIPQQPDPEIGTFA